MLFELLESTLPLSADCFWWHHPRSKLPRDQVKRSHRLVFKVPN